MDTSQRLSLPFILPGQAQKELYHNEALQILDSLVAPAVEDIPLNDPPNGPAAGTCFLVGTAPTGDWSGNGNSIASFTEGGWRFSAAVEGLEVWIKSVGVPARFTGGAWQVGVEYASKVVINNTQVVGQQGPAIADPSGGASIDAEARAAVSSILGAMRQHGLIASN